MASNNPAVKDYYAILDVPEDAPQTLIKQNYRSLVQRYHPDLFHEKEDAAAATLRMIEINEAFAVLSNKRRRAEYDIKRLRKSAPAAPVEEPAPEPEVKLRTPTARQAPAQRNTAVDQAVSQQFLQTLKKSIVQRGAALKFKEEAEKSWTWSFSAKTWSRSYWVGLRHLPALNVNSLREMLAQMSIITRKCASGWKSSAFIFVVAAESFQEGEQVLKLCRSYCAQRDNMSRMRRVNIMILDLIRRTTILCGPRPQDPKLQSLVNIFVGGQ